MSHLPFTISAYFLNACAVLVYKFMISKVIPNPLTYVFYFSAFSLIALGLLPFTPFPSLVVFILASASTLFWTAGAYFMLSTLKLNQASRVVPIIGSLVPILLFIYDGLNKNIANSQFLIVLILIAGLLILISPQIFLDKQKNLRYLFFKEVPFELISALLFATSYIVLKEAYSQASFLTVLSFSRVILIPLGISLIILPSTRQLIFGGTKSPFQLNFFSKVGLLFLAGQAAGGLSELLITYSISLATPSLVNSLQGTQYAFLFLASLALTKKYPAIFKEKLTVLNISIKFFGLVLIGIGLYLLSFGS